jgi:hypothetical protein
VAGLRGIEPLPAVSKTVMISISPKPVWSRYYESNVDLLFRREPFYPLNYSELVLQPRIELGLHSYQECVLPFNYRSSIEKGSQGFGLRDSRLPKITVLPYLHSLAWSSLPSHPSPCKDRGLLTANKKSITPHHTRFRHV